MKKRHLFVVIANFSAVVLLLALIALPIYFARNFAKVAGVKSESKFLVVSQIERFPNLTFAQSGDLYKITFTKQDPSQAYIGVLILNNPTENTQTYKLEVASGSAKPFFGEDLDNQLTQIFLPSTVSVPISLHSGPESTSESQITEFKVTADNE